MDVELKIKQKREAIKRMEKLGVIKEAIKQFAEDDKVMVSEEGFLYWLDDEQKKMVDEFEKDHGCLVYAVIHSKTLFGELYSILYVSRHTDEWEYDNEDLKALCPMAYVKNVDYDYCSEFGSIAVKNRFGGLVRVG